LSRILQGRQVKDHEEAGILPDRQHHQAGEDRAGVAEPAVAGNPEQAAEVVEDADLGRVEEEPDVGHRDHRQNGRGEVGGAHDRPAGQFAVDPDGHEQRQADADGDGAERVDKVIFKHLPEHRVVRHVGVVVQPDEPARPALARCREEAREYAADDRVVGKGHHQHRGRQKQQPGVNPSSGFGIKMHHCHSL